MEREPNTSNISLYHGNVIGDVLLHLFYDVCLKNFSRSHEVKFEEEGEKTDNC